MSEAISVELKWYSPWKGYGFFTQEDGDDILVHSTIVKSAQLSESDLANSPGATAQIFVAGPDDRLKCMEIVSIELPSSTNTADIQDDEKKSEPAEVIASEQKTGELKFFNSMKGYGFLIVIEGGEKCDYFFHADDLDYTEVTKDDLVPGRKFTFCGFLGDKGPCVKRATLAFAK